MKKAFIVVFGLLLFPLLVLPVVAIPDDITLTITAGTGSGWISGTYTGYDFHQTAKATKSGFKPFFGGYMEQDAITIDIWFKFHKIDGVQYLVSAYESSSDNLKIIISTTNIYFDVSNSKVSNARIETYLEVGKVYHIIGTWQIDDNSGKADIYGNGTIHTAADECDIRPSVNDDMWVSSADGSASYANVTIYSLAIYYFKFKQSHVNALTAPKTFFGNVTF